MIAALRTGRGIRDRLDKDLDSFRQSIRDREWNGNFTSIGCSLYLKYILKRQFSLPRQPSRFGFKRRPGNCGNRPKESSRKHTCRKECPVLYDVLMMSHPAS